MTVHYTGVNTEQPFYSFTMEPPRFGDWVRGNRRRIGLSQERLAAAIGMDRGHISKIENGFIDLPEIETRERFHQAFGTSEQDLIELGILPEFDQWGRRIEKSSIAASSDRSVAPTELGANAPLTPEEEAVLGRMMFMGLQDLSNDQLREIIAIVTRGR